MKTAHPNHPEHTREGAPEPAREDDDRALIDDRNAAGGRGGRRKRNDAPVDYGESGQPDHTGEAVDVDGPDDVEPHGRDIGIRDGDGLPVSAPKK